MSGMLLDPMEQIIVEAMKTFPPGQLIVLAMLIFIMRMIRELRDQFRQMNGSVRELKMWTQQHEKQDDERFQSICQLARR